MELQNLTTKKKEALSMSYFVDKHYIVYTTNRISNKRN